MGGGLLLSGHEVLAGERPLDPVSFPDDQDIPKLGLTLLSIKNS